MNSNARILIVDDQAGARKSLSFILEHEGYKTETAMTGEEALAKFRQNNYNLVLLDIVLPDMPGVDLIEPFQALRPDIVVMMVTGHASVETAVQSLSLGAANYVTKPFDMAKLLAEIKLALEKQHLTRENQRAEQALRESEARWRSLTETSPDHILTCDQDLKIRFANYASPGLTVQDLIGVPLYTLVEDGRQAEIKAILEGVLQTGEDASYDTEYHVPDGSVIYYESRVTPRRLTSSDEIIGLTISARNITERKRSDELLRASEERYRLMFENMSSGVVVYEAVSNGEDFIIKDFNRAAEKIEQISRKDVIGKNVTEVFPGVIEFGLLEVIQRVWRTGEAELQPISLYKDHRIVGWRENHVYKLPSGEVIASYNDISEKKKAELALLEREEQYRLLFDNMLNGFAYHQIVLDESGAPVDYRFLEVNPAFEKIVGFKQGGIMGKRVTEVIPGIERTGFDWIRTYGKVALTGRPAAFEQYLPDLGKWFSVTAYSPKKGYFATIFEDITERKQAVAELLLKNIVFESSIAANSIAGKDGVLTHVNQAFLQMWGYKTQQEVIGKPIASFFANPDEVTPVIETLDETSRWAGEFLALKADGSTFISRGYATVVLDEQGELIGYQSANLDVSEQKRMEKDLAASEAELLAVFNAMVDVVIVYDRDGRYLKIAPTNPANLYRPPDEMLGQRVHDILPKEAADLIVNTINRTLDAGQIQDCEYTLSIAGKEIVFFANVSPLTEDAVVWVARDITHQKHTQRELKQKAEEITSLFQQAERRLRTLQALHSVDQAIAGSFDIRITLNIFLDQVRKMLEVDAADVLLLDPHLQSLSYTTGIGFRTTSLQQPDLRIGMGHPGRAALERRPIFISNLRQEATGYLRTPTLRIEDFVFYAAVPLIAKGRVQGVLELFNRSPLERNSEWSELLNTMVGQAAVAIDNANLFTDLQQANIEMVIAYDSTLEGWAKALELRDMETEGHSRRVVDLTLQLAQLFEFGEKQLVHIRRGALLHDIGKMGIPDAILQKPDPLDEAEWQIMRQHPVYAYEWLSPINYLRPALDIPYCHHEHWDGSGYPRGLKGEQIPLAARLFMVVDVWDALRSDRPYRQAWPEARVRAYLQEQAGTHFDPQVVVRFLRMGSL